MRQAFGEIEKLHVTHATKWNQARIGFLAVTYGRNAKGLPKRLFVKLRRESDSLADIFPGERCFYEDARGVDLPIAPCLATVADQATGATCIVLEDLRATHVAVDWPMPPVLARRRQAMASLARVHAH